MVTIRLKGTLTEDRRLLVTIPDDVPSGEVDVILEIQRASNEPNEATARAREKFAAAGFLSTVWENVPVDRVAVDDDEIFELPPGSPTLDELIDDERAER